MRRLLALTALVVAACDGAAPSPPETTLTPIRVNRLEELTFVDVGCADASPDCVSATLAKAEAGELANEGARPILVNVTSTTALGGYYQLKGHLAPSPASPPFERYVWNAGSEDGAAAVARWCIAEDRDAPLCRTLRADPAVCNPLAEGPKAKLCAA